MTGTRRGSRVYLTALAALLFGSADARAAPEPPPEPLDPIGRHRIDGRRSAALRATDSAQQGSVPDPTPVPVPVPVPPQSEEQTPVPVPTPPLPVPTPVPDGERNVPTPAPVAQDAAPQPPERVAPYRAPYRSSSYTRGLLAVTLYPALISEFGGDSSPDGGLWLGGGMTIVNSLPNYYIPAARLHLTLGYSTRLAAIGFDVGTGLGVYFSTGRADLGLALRLGETNGTHLRLLLYWSPWPFPVAFPAGGELSLVAPITARTSFELRLQGDYLLYLWGAGTIGAQHRVGNGPRGESYITWGVGGAFVGLPAGLLQLGYEFRR